MCTTSKRGAISSAIAYSFIEYAKEKGLNPFFNLQLLIEELPLRDLEKLESFKDLMPWSKNSSKYYYIQSKKQKNAMQNRLSDFVWHFLL